MPSSSTTSIHASTVKSAASHTYASEIAPPLPSNASAKSVTTSPVEPPSDEPSESDPLSSSLLDAPPLPEADPADVAVAEVVLDAPEPAEPVALDSAEPLSSELLSSSLATSSLLS